MSAFLKSIGGWSTVFGFVAGILSSGTVKGALASFLAALAMYAK